MRLLLTALLLFALIAACRNPDRWSNPSTGIPHHPGGAPPIGYVRSQPPPADDDEPETHALAATEHEPDAAPSESDENPYSDSM